MLNQVYLDEGTYFWQAINTVQLSMKKTSLLSKWLRRSLNFVLWVEMIPSLWLSAGSSLRILFLAEQRQTSPVGYRWAQEHLTAQYLSRETNFIKIQDFKGLWLSLFDTGAGLAVAEGYEEELRFYRSHLGSSPQ